MAEGTTSGISGATTIAGASTNPDTSMSLNEKLLMLFLNRAQTMQGIAGDRTEEAQDKLKEIQDARAMKSRMNDLKEKADHDGHAVMPQDMKDYCEAHNVDWDHTGHDDNHNKDEWSVNIQYMDDFIDKLSSNNDLFMIKLRSVVDKSNEAVQGASGVENQAKDLMKDVLAGFR